MLISLVLFAIFSLPFTPAVAKIKNMETKTTDKYCLWAFAKHCYYYNTIDLVVTIS